MTKLPPKKVRDTYTPAEFSQLVNDVEKTRKIMRGQTKENTFNLRLGDGDRARLDELAKHFECTAAQVIRQLIKEKSAAIREADPPRVKP